MCSDAHSITLKYRKYFERIHGVPYHDGYMEVTIPSRINMF